MKSERRHELQHNDLAEWVINAYENVVPYKNSILGVGLLVIASAIGIWIWHNHSVAQASEGWNKLGAPVFQPNFADGSKVQSLDTISSEYAGTPAGEWAQVCAADSYLFFGENQVMDQREVGAQNIKNALDRYQKLLAAATAPVIRERAMIGAARALESLGQLQEALAAYEDLNKNFPKGTYKALADQRLEQLRTPDAAEFYQHLAQYTPKPKTEKSKEKEKATPASGPRGKVEDLGPLSPNPPEQPSGATPEAAKPKGTVAETSKTEPAKPQATAPEVPKTEPAKTKGTAAEAPKTEPAKPKGTAADTPKKS